MLVEALRNFFDQNSALVFFVYGQVFFVLGLAIALQSRRHSRLELARSLRWLSLFGLIHGLHEWGAFFIPLQATYASPLVLSALQVIQAILLGLSFAFLFQFGADLLRGRWPWLVYVPAAAGAIWALAAFVHLIVQAPSIGRWLVHVSIVARYLLGFPGALLAAYGLRHQAVRQIKPLGLEKPYRMLRVVGGSLVAYAFLAGLVVPAGSVFPTNWLNDSLPVRLVGVPVPVFRSVAGLIIAVATIRAMEVFDLEIDRFIEQMELERSLAAERERIGRELHDGAIQQAYTAGLIVESALGKVEPGGLVAQRLQRAISALNQAIASLRAYMGELRPTPDVSLVDGLRELAADPGLAALLKVDLQLDVPPSVRLDPARTAHALAVVGEALANVARHAQAGRARLRAEMEGGCLVLRVSDDGRGFKTDEKRAGYGLRNMRDRARLLGGQLDIKSEPGWGTRVTLSMPLEEH
jgi:signal transduction histidine kinase